jgi:hypothetical protein
MEFSEAKSLIKMHAGTEDGPRMATGFIGCLRPYGGLDDENFEEVVEAIAMVAHPLQAGVQVDRDLVHALWDMCHTARNWGVRESGMLPRNHRISPDDRRKLEAWVDVIETMTLKLLWGNPLPLAVSTYVSAVADARLPAPGPRLVSLFIESLAFDEDADVRMDAATALGRMGEAARDAVPALRICALDSDREVSRSAALALEGISQSPDDGAEAS